MDLNKTPRLLVMMFIQYFMQGAWNMTMGLVLSTYGMATIIGSSYALLGLATILSPLFIGMVADRFFSSQKVMAILHEILYEHHNQQTWGFIQVHIAYPL
ncbi:hypothetical protein ACUODF_48955, partial [Escherichia coli]